MNETERHKEAFEYWFSLGAKANHETCDLVATKMQLHRATVYRWYKAFNWRNRADIRLNANAKKIAEKSDTNIVNRKAKELADLDTTDTIIQAMLNEIVTKGEDGKVRLKVKIEDARDFAQVVGASEKVKKLKQLLLGEDTKREGGIIQVELANASQVINNKPKQADEDD